MVDWKRNNKCAIRNPDISVDGHDVVKLLIMRMLRRTHDDSYKVQIESESAIEGHNNYPDIRMVSSRNTKHGHEVCNWEIQKNITSKWRELKNNQYQGADWIEVDLKKISNKLEQSTGWSLDDFLVKLRHAIESEGVII